MSNSQWEDIPLVTVNAPKLRREAATFGRFAVVGLVGAVLDFSVLNLLIFGFGWSSPLQMAAANIVSTSVAILSNFFLNRRWTFRTGVSQRRWLQFLQFLAVSAAGLLINVTVFYLANHYIFGPLLHTALAVQLAKAAAIGVGMFWNFIVNRLWTFRHSGANSKGTTAMSASESSTPTVEQSSQPAARPSLIRSSLAQRWLLPLGVGLLLLAGINLGLYGRLAAPPTVAQSASQQPATPGPAPAAPAAPAAPEPGPAAVVPAMQAGDLRLAATFTAGSEPSEWLTLAGNWQVIDDALVQTEADGYDRAALHVDSFAGYALRVRFKLLEGTGAGLLFNAPGTQSKDGGHMVRFTDDGSGLFWGHFSPEGVFAGQGYAATGAPGPDWHVLEIFSGDTSYAIHLDGVPVAEGVPLISAAGHVGLTTSQSTAAFANVEVFDLVSGESADGQAAVQAAVQTGAQTGAQAELNGSGMEFSTINGDWVQDGPTIRQENSTATDFLLGTGVSAENYTLELVITLPEDPALADAGGGILFHMPARDRKEGAQMVRFVDGGAGLTWGRFEPDGAFTGQGYVKLSLPPGTPLRLALAVRGNEFDVLIDEEAVVEAVPAETQAGWIGLISYRGPVTFEDIKLSLGSVVP